MTLKTCSHGTGVIWRTRRAEIAEAVVALYRKRPWRSVTIEEAADWLGISYWQIYYSFDGREDMYRAAVERLIDRVADETQFTSGTYATVNQAITDYVRHLATVIAGTAYSDLVFLCLRDEETDPWIRSAYQRRILGPMQHGLEEIVRAAGARHDVHLILLDDVPEDCIAMLDCSLCISQLWRAREIPPAVFEASVSDAAKLVFRSTCTFDGFVQTERTRNTIAATG